MANSSEVTTLENLCDTEGGTQTIANFRTYYQAYCTEQYASNKLSYTDYLSVIESYMRNSALPGAV